MRSVSEAALQYGLFLAYASGYEKCATSKSENEETSAGRPGPTFFMRRRLQSLNIFFPNGRSRNQNAGQVFNLSRQDAILSYKRAHAARRNDNLRLSLAFVA